MTKIKKYEFLVKYIISYFVILALPLCILFLFVYNRFFNLMEQNTLRSCLDSTVQIRNTIDRNIYRIDDVADSVINSLNLDINVLNGSFFDKYISVKRLKDIKNSNDYIDAIILSLDDSDILLTDNGTINKRYFGKNSFIFKENTQEDIQRLFKYTKQRTIIKDRIFIPNIGERDCIVYMFPVPSGIAVSDAIISVVIDVSSIMNDISSEVDNKDRTVFILDENNDLVCSTGNMDISPFKEDVINNESEYRDSRVFKVANKKYCISHVKSLETGWTYVSVISYDKINMDIVRQRNIFFSIFMCLMIIGDLTIYMFVRMNYKPLKNITDQVKSIADPQSSLNEIETIKFAVNSLMSNIDIMSMKIQTARPAICSYVVMSLLKKRIKSKYELNRLTADYGFEINKNYFTVAMLVFSKCENLYTEEIKKQINRIASEEMDIYQCEDTFKQEMVLLINTDYESIDIIYEKMILLSDNIKNICNEEVNIGIGNTYQDIMMIPKSYMESSIAVEYQNIASECKVTTFGEFVSLGVKEDSISYFLRDFEFYIAQNDIEAVVKFPKRLKEYVEKSYISIHWANTIIFDIIRVIGRNISDSKESSNINKKLWDYVYELIPIQSVDDFEEILVNICNELAQQLLKNQKKKSEDEILQGMISYINENCIKADFSLQQMAEFMNISPSWASHYFKNKMKITLIEYVNQRKIDKAKSMIENDEATLNEISEYVGYTNVSSFIRAFKKIVRMTPGQYKKFIDNKKDVE